MQENSQIISENPMGNTKKEKTPKQPSASKNFILSLIALGIVVIFTGAMKFLEFQTNNQISTINESKKKIEDRITQLKNDKRIVIASLISDNALIPSVDLKQLVINFREAATRAGVQFKGFNLQDNIISTQLTARVNPGSEAAQTIIKMMKEYEKMADKGAFRLEPILSISGTPIERTTSIAFKILPKEKPANDIK